MVKEVKCCKASETGVAAFEFINIQLTTWLQQQAFLWMFLILDVWEVLKTRGLIERRWSYAVLSYFDLSFSEIRPVSTLLHLA